MAKLLYVLAHSTDQPERTTAALGAAAAAAKRGHEVALWLADEGVRLGVQGVVETIASPDRRGALESMGLLVEQGAVLYCPRACFALREFEETALRPGARIASQYELADLAADGWVPIPT